MDASDQLRTDAYLAQLNRALKDVAHAEREEIVREARSHILDRLERREGDLDAIFADMGPAPEYAASFLDGIPVSRQQDARLSVTGRIADAAVRVMSAILHSLAVLLVVIAVYKLFRPSRIGLWRLPTTGSASLRLQFGMGGDVDPAGVEILGYWLVLLAAVLAITLVGTGRILRRIRQRRRRSAQP